MRDSATQTTAQPQQRRYLDPRSAADFLDLSAATLAKWRCTGSGPVFRRFGGVIRYSIADLDAWAEKGARTSTSDVE